MKTLTSIIQFLKLIFGDTFPGLLAIWNKQTKETNFFGSDALDKCASYCLKLCKTSDVYFGLGLLNPDVEGTKSRGKADDVVAIPGFWMDIDIGQEGHKSTKYPPDKNTAWKILRTFPIKPSLVVDSGYGLHVYYLFAKPWLLDTPEKHERAKALSSRFQKAMQDIFAASGYTIDNTSDLARVLRVAGTKNLKGDTPKQVEVIWPKNVDTEPLVRTSPKEIRLALENTGEEASAPTVPAKKTRIGFKKDKGDAFAPGNGAVLFDENVGCQFMIRARDEAQNLTEPEWVAVLSVIRTCENGHELAHKLSEPYPGYTETETDKKLSELERKGIGPRTCINIRDNFGDCCQGCPHNVKSPAVLASQPKYSKLLDAVKEARQALAAAEKGDNSAHLSPAAIRAFSLLKRHVPKTFSELREELKKNRCPMPGFDKALVAEMKSEAGFASAPPPEPIYQPIIDALAETEYHLNEKGYLCTTDDNGSEVKVANHIIVPQKEITLDDGVTQTKQFEVMGIASGGKELPPAVISVTDLNSMQFNVKNWGLKAKIFPGYNNMQSLKDAIFELEPLASPETIYAHTGWRKVNGNWVFLHGAGAIGGNTLRVELDNEIKSYRLPNLSTASVKAIQASLKLRHIAPYEVTIPLLALTFLAPLCEAARAANLEPKFVFWLFGRTNSKKTTLALLFLQHFGPFTNPPASFKDTANAVERKAFIAKDVLILQDDFHPAGSRKAAEAMRSLAFYVLRLYGDRISRGRLTPNITLRESFPPRGMAIITAEDIPPGKESDVARTFAVKISGKDVDINKLSLAQANASMLPQTMAAYIAWLAPQMDTLPNTLQERFFKLRRKYGKIPDNDPRTPNHARVLDAAAFLTFAWEMFISFAKDKGAIDEKRASLLLKIGQKIFAALVTKQAIMVRGQQPVEIFLSQLRAQLDSRQLQVQKLNDKVEVWGQPNSSLIGYFDDEFYYLFHDLVYAKVNQSLQASEERLGISPKMLWDHLAEAGHIKVEVENKGLDTERRMHLVKKQISPSKRPRMLWLKKSSVHPA